MALTDAQIKTIVAALLKKDEDLLPSYFDTLITKGNTFAQQEIKGRLLRRGFSLAQTTGFDRFDEFTLDLACWWVLTRAGMLDAYSDLSLKVTDRREELDTVLVFVDGEWVQPPTGNPGLVASGGPSSDGGIFNWPDPDDSNLGEVTKW